MVVYDLREKKFIDKIDYSFVTKADLFVKLNYLVKKHLIKGMIIGEAFGQKVVVKSHSKFYGVIELVAEHYDMPTIYVSDRTARAIVLGKGNGNKKEMVKEYFNEDNQDIADAMLFAKWYEETT